MAEYLVRIDVKTLEEGGFLATSKDLQGLIAQGRTMAETLEIAQDVARRLIESRVEHGVPVGLRKLGRKRTGIGMSIPVAIEA